MSRQEKTKPPDTSWKPKKGLSQAERRREQDQAAGGSDNRLLQCEDGHLATASIALRVQPAGYKVYAYLRWLEHGCDKTRERYVGAIAAGNRADALAEAWLRARERGFTNAKQSAG